MSDYTADLFIENVSEAKLKNLDNQILGFDYNYSSRSQSAIIFKKIEVNYSSADEAIGEFINEIEFLKPIFHLISVNYIIRIGVYYNPANSYVLGIDLDKKTLARVLDFGASIEFSFFPVSKAETSKNLNDFF